MPKKSKCLPPHAMILSQYVELENYARAFAAGHLKSLVLIGPPGVGKSSTFRGALNEQACWIAGNASPFGIFLKAHQYANEPIVLDDIDDLYRHPQGVRLLKALCQTDRIRTLSWNTQARELTTLGVPREFQTTSSVCLIANEWETVGPNVAAIEDRVHLLVFQPSSLEIHLQSAKWFWDQEIFDFIADHLSLLGTHSLRLYGKASELKAAGMDWHATVLAKCFSGAARFVAQLRADPTYESEEERVRAFVRDGHGCRATYFNYAKRLPSSVDTPKIELRTKVPPPVFAETMDRNERLRRLHRESRMGR